MIYLNENFHIKQHYFDIFHLKNTKSVLYASRIINICFIIREIIQQGFDNYFLKEKIV